MAAEPTAARHEIKARLAEWLLFLRGEAHILLQSPSLLFQQALNQRDDTNPARTAGQRERDAARLNRYWFRWINKPRTPGACVQTFGGHTDGVTAVAFGAHGRTVVSGSADGTLRIWDAGDGRPISVLSAHPGGVTAMALTHDGRRAISGGKDGRLKFWDLELAAETEAIQVGPIAALASSADGGRIAYALEVFSDVFLIDGTGRRVQRLPGHHRWASAVALSADGKLLASGAQDGSVRIWDADSGRELALLSGHTNEVGAIVLSRDGGRLVSASGSRNLGLHDTMILVWDLRRALQPRGMVDRFGSLLRMPGRPNRTLLHRLRGHTFLVNSLAVTADGYLSGTRLWGVAIRGRRLAVGDSDGGILLFEVCGRETASADHEPRAAAASRRAQNDYAGP